MKHFPLLYLPPSFSVVKSRERVIVEKKIDEKNISFDNNSY